MLYGWFLAEGGLLTPHLEAASSTSRNQTSKRRSQRFLRSIALRKPCSQPGSLWLRLCFRARARPALVSERPSSFNSTRCFPRWRRSTRYIRMVSSSSYRHMCAMAVSPNRSAWASHDAARAGLRQDRHRGRRGYRPVQPQSGDVGHVGPHESDGRCGDRSQPRGKPARSRRRAKWHGAQDDHRRDHAESARPPRRLCPPSGRTDVSDLPAYSAHP